MFLTVVRTTPGSLRNDRPPIVSLLNEPGPHTENTRIRHVTCIPWMDCGTARIQVAKYLS